MNVQNVMNAPVVSCRPDDTLNTAARLMWEEDCGAITVVDDDSRLTGIITDRDICMAAFLKGVDLHSIPVSSAMSGEVFSCHFGDTLETAEALMSEHQIRRIPVLDDEDRVIGLLSLGDIARHAVSSRKKNGLDREITRTLAAICAPRSPAETSRAAKRPTPKRGRPSATP